MTMINVNKRYSVTWDKTSFCTVKIRAKILYHFSLTFRARYNSFRCSRAPLLRHYIDTIEQAFAWKDARALVI